MVKSGEISENAYSLIVNELGEHLSISIKEMFRLRKILELARARAKVEWAKEKTGLAEFEAPERQRMLKDDTFLRRELFSSLYKWEDVISKIDAALSSLTVEEEASIIERYLSFPRERLNQKERSGEIEGAEAACQQRLDSISERWASIRRDKIEKVLNLQPKVFKIKEEIEEVELRFAVSELKQSTYEYRMSILQGSLKQVEREISDVRNYVDEMDVKIFRCLELLKEKR